MQPPPPMQAPTFGQTMGQAPPQMQFTSPQTMPFAGTQTMPFGGTQQFQMQPQQFAMPGSPQPGQIVQIECRHTPGKCLDVKANSKKSGAEIVNYDPNGGANQKFMLQYTQQGLQILPQSTNLPLGVEKNKARESVEQLDKAQFCTWQAVPCLQSDGWFYLKLITDYLYMGLEYGCSEKFTRIVVGELTHGFHQQFRFI